MRQGPKPDHINPQSPDEVSPPPLPDEQPREAPPEVNPAQPDEIVPGPDEVPEGI